MREILFHGKRVDNGEWVEGYYVRRKDTHRIINFQTSLNAEGVRVFSESVGQYTGMNEFVVTDRSYDKPLFEGDIVEVWGWRSPTYTYDAKSQYDGKIKVRAVICFKNGEWTLDYTNKYNKSLAKLKGKEVDNREVSGDWSLYRYGSRNNEEWVREHNYKWHDIVKIGNVFDDVELLEG